jgi:hypothetical protein
MLTPLLIIDSLGSSKIACNFESCEYSCEIYWIPNEYEKKVTHWNKAETHETKKLCQRDY